jgi:hypothetical protein
MNRTELWGLRADISADQRDASSVPVEEVRADLAARNDGRRRAAAAVLAVTAQSHPGTVEPVIDDLAQGASDSHPAVRADCLSALAAVCETAPEGVGDSVDALVAGLKDDDPEARQASTTGIVSLLEATSDPGSTPLSDHTAEIRSAVTDPVPAVRAGGFTALSELVETVPDQAIAATESAFEALSAGAEVVRERALYYLIEVSEVHPQTVADDAVGEGLTDSVGMHRSHAACVIGNVGEDDTAFVRRFQTALVTMLTDPEPLARQNAAYALALVALDDPASVADAGAGEHILPLLETELVGAQENGIQLLALLLEHDATAVGQPEAVSDQLRDLRTEDALSIDDEFIRDVQDMLEQDSDDTTESTPSGSEQKTDRTSQTAETRTDSTADDRKSARSVADNTEVFSSGSGTAGSEGEETATSEPGTDNVDAGESSAPQSGRTTSRSANFCPDCGSDLRPYDDPNHCPDCGGSI